MQPAPQSNLIFGRYRLLEQLGQGGMAQIWRARLANAQHDGHELVVKTLHPQLLNQPLFAELLAAEARVTRLLTHPGIVQVIEAGKVQGQPYLAMERIDGWDLAALHRALPAGRRLPMDVLLSIAIEMCRAVGYAHDWRDTRGKQRPIVHGDLSPSNVMVRRDGGVTLIDFGVAHMDPRVARGRANLVIGKRGYLAPELLDDAVADARSDVFSAGVVLYELLTGRHLFVVESERETLRRLTEATIPPPSKANSRVTPELDAIVLRALCRDPRRRFASANDLANALERLTGPERGTRQRVAACLHYLFERGEGAVTTPTAPAAPLRLASRTARALTPDRGAPRHHRPTSGVGRALFAVAALIVVFLTPLPNAPAAQWPLVAVDVPAATVARPTKPVRNLPATVPNLHLP